MKSKIIGFSITFTVLYAFSLFVLQFDRIFSLIYAMGYAFAGLIIIISEDTHL